LIEKTIELGFILQRVFNVHVSGWRLIDVSIAYMKWREDNNQGLVDRKVVCSWQRKLMNRQESAPLTLSISEPFSVD
jgi:hypothetical protein